MGHLEPGRILGVDYGHRRIGLAISDPGGTFAFPLETITVQKNTDTMAVIRTTCEAHQITQIVLGLPRNMDGSEGFKAAEVRTFAGQLSAAVGLPIVLFDERLTSKLAEQTLRAQGIQASRNKALIDQAAAQRILQDYLDSRSHRHAPNGDA